MKKYNLSKEYGIYRMFYPPLNKFVIKIANLVLSLIPLISSKFLGFKKEKIKVDDDYVNLYLFDYNDKSDKIILYIHGGAFVVKGYFCHFNLCKTLAKEVGCKLLYVDYRTLKYPVSFNDCYMAYKWILENAKLLNIDPKKIIVVGDSAGGELASSLVFKTIDEVIIKPCFLMLIYPVLDKRMKSLSIKKYSDTPMWNAKLNKKMWDYYLDGSNYVSSCERDDLSGFCPVYIEVAEFDCLHDEGVEFYHSLKKCGIEASLHEVKNSMHGYDVKRTSITKKAINLRIKELKKIR